MKTQQRASKVKGKSISNYDFAEKPVVAFEADILAAEDFDRIYRSRPLSPERELIAAVWKKH